MSATMGPVLMTHLGDTPVFVPPYSMGIYERTDGVHIERIVIEDDIMNDFSAEEEYLLHRSACKAHKGTDFFVVLRDGRDVVVDCFYTSKPLTQ